MARFDIKFKHSELDFITVQCEKSTNEPIILVRINVDKSYTQIRLDKSTAIKFAKTLRTEINKITESEVNNG